MVSVLGKSENYGKERMRAVQVRWHQLREEKLSEELGFKSFLKIQWEAPLMEVKCVKSVKV